MAKWGNADYRQLQKLRDNLQKLQDVDMEKFCADASKRLAARLLQLVIPDTPVGSYPASTGKNGGTLRRGWTARTEEEAAAGSGDGKSKVAAYVNSLPITKRGKSYTIEVINPVHYASYVEFGHRQTPGRYVPALGKSLKQGWVNGKYFLTFAETQLEQKIPSILEKELEKLLRDIFKV